MPVEHRKLKPNSPIYTALVIKLENELLGKSINGPRVIEEEQFNNCISTTVIWDDWKDLLPEERSRAIMDAYELARPIMKNKTNKYPNSFPVEMFDLNIKVEHVTCAIGLTLAEATKLGIK
jgi:hypothetical protein